jgi:para-nitrobenzyl esterase
MKFICPSRTVTRTFVKGQPQPVFRYFLTQGFENGGPLLASFGAWHGADIFYLFDTMSGLGNYTPSDTELRISEAMMAYWNNLAIQGDPSGPGLAFWPRAADGFDRYFQFDGSLQSSEGVRTRQCDLWDEIGRLLR